MTLDEFFDKFKNLPNKFHFTGTLCIRDEKGMCPIVAMVGCNIRPNSSNMMASLYARTTLNLNPDDACDIIRGADNRINGRAREIRTRMILCRPELIVPELKRELKQGTK